MKLSKLIGRRLHLYVEWRPVIVVRANTHPDRPDPLDEAMHTVWLEGKWRWVTGCMTTEAREAAVAAVMRYDRAMKSQEPDETLLTRGTLVWWD